MAAALEHFSDRLMAGARTDLLALAKIPFIKSRTAYVFFSLFSSFSFAPYEGPFIHTAMNIC